VAFVGGAEGVIGGNGWDALGTVISATSFRGISWHFKGSKVLFFKYKCAARMDVRYWFKFASL
jgi:hypothetical protein